MNTTKKMPSSLGKNGQPIQRSEFVIPQPDPKSQAGFYGLTTGKTHPLASISYIGRSITADDVIEKLTLPTELAKTAKARIDTFLAQLQEFKIGNIISITYQEDGSFELALEAVRATQDKKTRLP